MNDVRDIIVSVYKDLLFKEPNDETIEAYSPFLQEDLTSGVLFLQQQIKNSDEYNNTTAKNIEKLLPPAPEFQQRYEIYRDHGKKYLETKKIAFVGLARNVENTITNCITKLINLGNSAKEYRIVIFENDSIDNTKQILKDLQNTNDRIFCISENNNRPQFGQTKEADRTIALAQYRNVLKQYIADNYKDYDFVVVTDLDFIDFSPNGCYNTFGWFALHPEISAIAGNSYEFKTVTLPNEKTLWNYDSWAFRHNWWNELPNYRSITYYSMMWFGFFIMPVGGPLLSVNSAFGGMTAYKTSQFLNATYEGYDCEHVCFHYNLKKNITDFQLFLNPSQIMLL